MQVFLTLVSELRIWIRCIDEIFPPEFLTVWSSLRVDDQVVHDDDTMAELDRGRERKISLGNKAISLKEERQIQKLISSKLYFVLQRFDNAANQLSFSVMWICVMNRIDAEHLRNRWTYVL